MPDFFGNLQTSASRFLASELLVANQPNVFFCTSTASQGIVQPSGPRETVVTPVIRSTPKCVQVNKLGLASKN